MPNNQSSVAKDIASSIQLSKEKKGLQPKRSVSDIVSGFFKGVGNFSREVGKGAVRPALSFGEAAATIPFQVAELLTDGRVKAPEPPAASTIPGLGALGPVASYQRGYKERVGAGEKPSIAGLKEAGSFLLDEPAGLAIKPIALAGGFIFRSSKSFIPKLAAKVVKDTDPISIAKILDESIHKVSAEKISEVSQKLAATVDSKEVTSILDNFIKETGASTLELTKPRAYQVLDSTLKEAGDAISKLPDDGLTDASLIFKRIEDISQTARKTDTSVGAVNKLVLETQELLQALKSARQTGDDMLSQALKKAEDAYAGRTRSLVESLEDGTVQVNENVAKFETPLDSLRKTADTIVQKGTTDIVDNGITIQRFEEIQKEMSELFKRNADGTIDDVGLKRLDEIRVELQKPISRGTQSPQNTADAGFSATVRESARTLEPLAKRVKGIYNPITNKETLEKATEILARGDAAAMAHITETENMTPEIAALGQLLIEKFQRANKIDDAVSVVEIISKKATSQGQAIQALSLWNRLSPAGVLRYAQKELVKHGKKLDSKLADDLVADSEKIKNMEDGWERSFETAKMMKRISDKIPVDKLKKLALAHTMLLLLNPKTWIRNLVGNSGFLALENVSDVFAAGFDSALSLVTGTRTKVPPSVLHQSKGFLKGGMQGWKESMAGVNTLAAKTQFDVPQTTTFKGPVGKALEKLLSVELRVPDRAFFQSAYDGSLYNQIKSANINAKKSGKDPILEPTPEMMEVAVHDGLYRTFQDDTILATSLSRLKRGLNKFTGSEEFGIGDVLVKFPKTPGAILTRGIEYSPAGFMRSVYEASKPLMGKEFDQKAFVESFSRATVGSSALVGTGSLLAKLGIVTGKDEQESLDVAGAKRSLGLGNYKINASALKRFALSGMDPAVTKHQKGDKLYTYDWFQPAAVPLVMGANIGLNNGIKDGSFIGEMVQAVVRGADTLVEQPVLGGISKYTENIGYYGFSEATAKLVATLPSSFVPTVLSQIRQLMDNNSRNTYSKDTADYAMNLVKDRVPGLSTSLPKRFDAFGGEQERYHGGTNNLFNVFFNPVFRTQYTGDKTISEVLKIYDQTGDAGAVPDVKRSGQKVNGEDVQLGPKTQERFQKFVGSQTRFYLDSLTSDPAFAKLEPQEKADYITQILRDIHAYAKIVVLGDRPKSPSKRVRQMLLKDGQ